MKHLDSDLTSHHSFYPDLVKARWPTGADAVFGPGREAIGYACSCARDAVDVVALSASQQ